MNLPSQKSKTYSMRIPAELLQRINQYRGFLIAKSEDASKAVTWTEAARLYAERSVIGEFDEWRLFVRKAFKRG